MSEFSQLYLVEVTILEPTNKENVARAMIATLNMLFLDTDKCILKYYFNFITPLLLWHLCLSAHAETRFLFCSLSDSTPDSVYFLCTLQIRILAWGKEYTDLGNVRA